MKGYGITETYCGCPIRASMETVEVCRASEGFPVHFDKHAFAADHVVVCGRVKPHTSFVGEIESGLMKIMAIGLGKQKGADLYHNAIVRLGHYPVLTSVARVILDKCPIAFGLAVVKISGTKPKSSAPSRLVSYCAVFRCLSSG